jgi:hypothetical protein
VASTEFGLSVVDVSSPQAPRVLGVAMPPVSGVRVAVRGTVALVTGDTGQGTAVVDVSVPTAPRVLSTLAGTMTGAAMGTSYGYLLLSVSGNPGHTDLGVVDLRVPTSPSIVGRVTLPGWGYDVKVVGTVAYVAAGSAGLQVVDVANPTAPRIIGARDTAGTAYGVAVANGVAYVADYTAVVAMGVTTPSAPTLMGTYTTAAMAVAAVGSMVYVVDGGTQFKIVDFANPTAPWLRSTSAGYEAVRVTVSGTWAYLASPGNPDGIYVYDVTSPAAPVLRTRIDVAGWTVDVAATPSYVYASDSAAITAVISPGQ